MTRKDFELIASAIADLYWIGDLNRLAVAERFADKLTSTNAMFDRERFLKACGVATSTAKEQYLHRDLLTEVKFTSPHEHERVCECLGKCAE